MFKNTKERSSVLRQRKRVTVIEKVNGQSFSALFPNRKNEFDDFADAVKSVAQWLRVNGSVPSFSLKTKRTHPAHIHSRV